MKYRILLTFFLGALLLTGCTKEDLSACATRTAFACVFELNDEHTDQFAELVNKVDLYIFDASGLLIKHVSQARDFSPEKYTLAADLAQGTYTAVLYGTDNVNKELSVGTVPRTRATDLAAMKEGESRMSDMRLSLNDFTEQVDKELGVVLHGIVSQFTVTSKPEVHNVSFVRNTHVVELNISGLEHLVPESHVFPNVKVLMEGHNKSYLYDNTLDPESSTVTHAPYWKQYINNILTSHFSILRLFKEQPLTLKIESANDVIWQINLTEEIMKSPDYSTNEDLDREDTFVVNIVVTTSGGFNIKVNGWTTTTSGGIIG